MSNTPPPAPPAGPAGQQISPGDAAPRPAEFAVSASIGPIPAIFVARSPDGATAPPAPGAAGLLGHALARALHLAGRRAGSRRSGPGTRQSGHEPGGTRTGSPADLRFSRDHLWARPGPDGAGVVRVGVTEFAQQSLGDVVEVTLPEPGESVQAGEPCGDIESVKSVSDLVSPVAGTVRSRNDALAGAPGLVNSDPYGDGWMLEIEVDPGTLGPQLADLMDEPAYRSLTGA